MEREMQRAIMAKECGADYLPYVGEYVVWKEEDKWWFGVGEGNALAQDLRFKVGVDEETKRKLVERYERFQEYSRKG